MSEVSSFKKQIMFRDCLVQKYMLVSNTHVVHIGLQAVKFKMEPRPKSNLGAL